MTSITEAHKLAVEVAWQGHSSDKGIAALAARKGITGDVPAIIKAAVACGMLKPVPRLGGYVAGRKVNESVFGKAFTEMIYGLVNA